MRCPVESCRSWNIGVIKTASFPNSKVRLRICYNCKCVFETKEVIIESGSQPDFFSNVLAEEKYSSVIERRKKSGRIGK